MFSSPAILLRTLMLGAVLFAVAVGIEAGTLAVWKQRRGWRIIRNLAVVNMVSGLLYIVIASLPFVNRNPDSPIPDLITPLLFLVVTWTASTVSEGIVWNLLEQELMRISWGTAFVLNTVSGIVLLLSLLALPSGLF